VLHFLVSSYCRLNPGSETISLVEGMTYKGSDLISVELKGVTFCRVEWQNVFVCNVTV